MVNKTSSHPIRMKHFLAPVGTEDWFMYLRVLSGNQIQWNYQWLRPSHAMVSVHELYFIELIGLKGVQPYAPLEHKIL